jgi:phospholipid/cholesterol/gamma-HCH transport system substrate-binding protein
MIDSAGDMVANMKDVSISLKKLLEENEEKLNNMIANMEEFSEDISYQVNQDEKDSAMAEIKEILLNAKKATGDMQAIAADLRNGKGTLGQFLVDEEIADEVKETLAGIRKIVTKVDAIRTELELYTGVNTEVGGESDLSLKIFPSPERFYILGLSTSKLGPKKESIITSEINGVSIIENKRIEDRDTVRFNIQLGRSFHNWSFRGGLIESTGGFGVDYDIYNWGTKFIFEIFDYRTDIGPNLRIGSKVHLWNVFYGRVAVDDILNNTRGLTISAGLKFNDEDLKGLIGFFL